MRLECRFQRSQSKRPPIRFCIRFIRPNAPRLDRLFADFKNQRRSKCTMAMHQLRPTLHASAEDHPDARISVCVWIPGKCRDRHILNQRALTFEIRKGIVLYNLSALVSDRLQRDF